MFKFYRTHLALTTNKCEQTVGVFKGCLQRKMAIAVFLVLKKQLYTYLNCYCNLTTYQVQFYDKKVIFLFSNKSGIISMCHPTICMYQYGDIVVWWSTSNLSVPR